MMSGPAVRQALTGVRRTPSNLLAAPVPGGVAVRDRDGPFVGRAAPEPSLRPAPEARLFHSPAPASPVRVAVLGTFPPTQCGLATFAHSLVGGFAGIGVDVDVVSVVAGSVTRPAPGVARHWSVEHDSPDDVAAALDRYDVVILQHEYGIYPGADGHDVLDLVRQLHVPVVTVLHTVLEAPTDRQRAVLVELVSRSAGVVTMT